jgi:hypothetical protein
MMRGQTVKLVVSNSELGDFRTCKRRWGYRYIDMLRPRVEARVLRWGTTFHTGLERGYLAAVAGGMKDPVADAKRGAAEAVEEACIQERVMLLRASTEGALRAEECDERLVDVDELERCASWAVENFFTRTATDFDRLVLLAVEWPFRVPVMNKGNRPSATWLTGKVDVVWWDPQSRQVLVDDHKTTDGDAAGTGIERRIMLDPQMSGYIQAVRYAATHQGLQPLDGSKIHPDDLARGARGWCRYNMVRRTAPKSPQLKLNGEVSVAACDTTAGVYELALMQQAERGIAVNDKQREMLERLSRQQDKYFSRHEFARSSEDESVWRDEVFADARMMRMARRDARLRTRNASACTMANSMPCAYTKLCLQDAPETRSMFRVAETMHEEVGNGEQVESK